MRSSSLFNPQCKQVNSIEEKKLPKPVRLDFRLFGLVFTLSIKDKSANKMTLCLVCEIDTIFTRATSKQKLPNLSTK